MGEMDIVRDEPRNGVVTLHVSGVVDGAMARRLQVALDREQHPVVVDFSRVRDFYDFAVALLAHRLSSQSGSRVIMTGLREHQLRMFRYFGVDPAVGARGAEGAPLG